MAIQSFRQLRIFRRSVELRQSVFQLSKAWPKEERYSLVDQIRRSSRAVGAAMAEAWSKRRFERHFVSKLTDAHAEASETAVWLDVAMECGYLTVEDHESLTRLRDEIGGGLVKMMQESQKWTVPNSMARDTDADYDTGSASSD